MKNNNFKKAIGKIHLWLGLSSGIIVFIIAVTGCLYAFQEEIQNITEEYRFVEKQDKPRKSLNKNKPTVKADEFKQLLTTLGDILNPWEVDFIYQNLTINKDNTIDVSEFKNLLLIPHI